MEHANRWAAAALLKQLIETLHQDVNALYATTQAWTLNDEDGVLPTEEEVKQAITDYLAILLEKPIVRDFE